MAEEDMAKGCNMSKHCRTSRRSLLVALGASAVTFLTFRAEAAPPVLVHKDPNCGCCNGWVAHLKAAGFEVTVDERSDLAAIRRRLGVPDGLAACHTAEIDGYVVEGHVPAEAIQRLLKERPAAIGLSVPGMPAGSPGMESPTPETYEVLLFGKSGRQLFMRFRETKAIG